MGIFIGCAVMLPGVANSEISSELSIKVSGRTEVGMDMG